MGYLSNLTFAATNRLFHKIRDPPVSDIYQDGVLDHLHVDIDTHEPLSYLSPSHFNFRFLNLTGKTCDPKQGDLRNDPVLMKVVLRGLENFELMKLKENTSLNQAQGGNIFLLKWQSMRVNIWNGKEEIEYEKAIPLWYIRFRLSP